MQVISLIKNFFESKNIIEELQKNLSSKLIEEIYINPKNISKSIIKAKLQETSYIKNVANTIDSFKEIDIEKYILDKMNSFEKNINYKMPDNAKIYVIIGLDTTTIYSIKFKDEDITILLLESTNGYIDKLDMLLAHEFTHFIRRKILNKDIFEISIGERFITEGIGCNYSEEIIANKNVYEYCLVKNEIVLWVKNNIDKLDEYIKNEKYKNDLMPCFFKMGAKTELENMPTRTGYVYGYYKVKEYLEKNNLKIKDIIGINWEEILK